MKAVMKAVKEAIGMVEFQEAISYSGDYRGKSVIQFQEATVITAFIDHHLIRAL